MLTIRLNRVGKKNQAQFRIVLQEHTAAPGGRHVEVLGSYNPHSKEVSLNEEKITYWISKGAQTSDTVHNILVNKGVIKEDKRKIKLPAKKKEAEAENAEKKEEKAAPADSKDKKSEETPQAEVKEEKPVEAENTPAGGEEVAAKAEESAPKKDEEEKKPKEAK